MLSRARYIREEEMETQEIGEDDEVEDYGYVLAIDKAKSSDRNGSFKDDLYGEKLRDIDIYLSPMRRQEGWSDKTFKDIRYQSYNYPLKYSFLWKRPKKKDGVPLRVIDDIETKNQILKEFHDILQAWHRGIWATYNKNKERYWQKGLYKDVEEFEASCIECQLQSKNKYKDELHPTYPLAMHF